MAREIAAAQAVPLMKRISPRPRNVEARHDRSVHARGIHPHFTAKNYLVILRTAKEAASEMHVHAISPLEAYHGASTLGIAQADYLAMLRDAGLSSLPGTAAEILVDNVRARSAPTS